jgi:hypothetical protein
MDSAETKRARLRPTGPVVSPIRQSNGIPADTLVVDLVRRRRKDAKAFAPAARNLQHPEVFLPAVEETLIHAVRIAKTIDLKKILHSLSSHEREELDFVFDIATGRSWQENLTGLRKAKQSWEENKQKLEATIATRMAAQMNFRIMEFKQKDEVEREVARRMSTGVDRAPANREVFKELLMLLDINAGNSWNKSKGKLALQNLFSIDHKHVAFIASRPDNDKWSRPLNVCLAPSTQPHSSRELVSQARSASIFGGAYNLIVSWYSSTCQNNKTRKFLAQRRPLDLCIDRALHCSLYSEDI